MHTMSYKILMQLCQYILKYPKRVIVFCFGFSLVFSLLVLGTKLNLSFMALFPREEPLIVRYLDVLEKVGLSKQLILLLEGEDEKTLKHAVDVLETELPKAEEVEYVIGNPPQKWMEDNLAWNTDQETFDALLALTSNISDTHAREIVERKVKEQILKKYTNARMMVIGLATDPFEVDVYDILEGKSPYEQLERKTQTILSNLSIQAGYTGFGAIGAQDQKRTLLSISALTPISLLAVLILLRLVESRILRLLSIAVPMLLALFACLGLTGFILGSITFTEGFFGLMVFGLGVDFGLHLLVRMREEQAKIDDFSLALTNTIVGCGPAIISGAVTTAGAFAMISFAPDPTAQHLGVSGCLGLLFCLVLMLTLLPAIWVLLERNTTQTVLPEFRIWGLENLVHTASSHPKKWVFGMIFFVWVALLGTSKYHFETDLKKIFNREVPAVRVSERVSALFGINTTAWVISSKTIKEARQIHISLEESPVFSEVVGISDIFPVEGNIRFEQLQKSIPQLEKNNKTLQMLSIGPPNISIPAQQARRINNSFLQAAQNGPISIDDMPISLKRQFVGIDGSFLTFAYANKSIFDAEEMKNQRLAAESIHPSAAGLGNFIEAAMNSERPWVVSILLSVIGFVLLVLCVDIRHPKWILLAFAPVTVGVLSTFGILCWMNVGFSVLLFVVVPLLLGLGVDDGLHVVHRMLEEPDVPAHEATISVSRAITMTTLTTCASFCVLLASNHPGMESMALTLLIGLPICFFASATLVPALAVLFGLREGPQQEKNKK